MFRLTKIEGGRINVYEPQVLPVGASPVTAGEALVLSGGKLVACDVAVKPTFVALADSTYTETDEFGNSTTKTRASIAVGRVEPNQIYAVEAVSGLTLGAKVKLTETADGLDASGTGAVEIVDLDTVTNTAYVRFV